MALICHLSDICLHFGFIYGIIHGPGVNRQTSVRHNALGKFLECATGRNVLVPDVLILPSLSLCMLRAHLLPQAGQLKLEL